LWEERGSTRFFFAFVLFFFFFPLSHSSLLFDRMGCLLMLMCLAAVSQGYQLVYDRPRACSKGPTPGAKALSKVVMAASGCQSQGIFNCRNARGGSNLSEHAEGRAWDAKVTPGDPRGQAIFEWMIRNAQKLGIQSVIYNRKQWGERFSFSSRF
jgi:hypothetical protein